jgi:arabinan endo-1,5-alpha-L-arabinosidase
MAGRWNVIRPKSAVHTMMAVSVFMPLLLATACGAPVKNTDQSVNALTTNSATVSWKNSANEKGSDTVVHDPTMIRQGRNYYVFSTGDADGVIGNGNTQIRSSSDLEHWRYVGTVFSTIPSWIKDREADIKNLWAPDISYFNGTYHLYYAASSFGSNQSLIALATNKTLNPKDPDYKWNDDGVVISSSKSDSWNAIDPNLVLDRKGEPWLAFGSFWTGIKLIRLDKRTGKPAETQPHVYSLAERPDPPDAIEASSIVYHYPYYYLFASYGFCCRGVNSTYTTRVGRSRNITGPYYDESEKPLLDGGGTILLKNEGNMIGPGGESLYQEGKRWFIVYHYYDAADNGIPHLQIRRIKWTKDGWPKVDKPIVPISGQ